MLDFDPYTVVFTLINLVILFLLLRHFLFKPVTKIMDERAQAARQGLEEADAMKEEAARMNADYEAQLADAREQAASLVAQAKERAGREYETILAQAQADAEQLRASTRTQLEAEREAMLRGARDEVAQLALLAAAKVSQQSMDEAGDLALVNAFLAEAGDLK